MEKCVEIWNKNIGGLDTAIMEETWKIWDTLGKPLRSLGRLEEMVVRLSGIYRTTTPKIGKKAVIVMGADNGVVEEGVTQSGSEVTATVIKNMGRGIATVCVMGKLAQAEVIPVDIGIAADVESDRVWKRKIRYGTENITKRPAMTREEAVKAIETGIETAGKLKENGYGLLATGEMGIGNTTTSSAMAAVYLNLPAKEVTGRGAGLSAAGLSRKVEAVKKAIELHKPDKHDPIDVLHKVGGLDIAGLTGCFIGAGIYRVPILVDGFISCVAAYTAIKLCPGCREYIFESHCSKEPAGRRMLDALGMRAYLEADMCLGEGTGAVVAMSLFDYALTAYYGIPSFSSADLEAYTHQK